MEVTGTGREVAIEVFAGTVEVVWIREVVETVKLRLVEVVRTVVDTTGEVDFDAVVLVGFTEVEEFVGGVLVEGLGTTLDGRAVGLRGRQAPAYGRVMVNCGGGWMGGYTYEISI